ncbi:MAG TPA: hypothetical protein VH054_08420 [Polyangiaceae bacterium]|jgi:hypothetical protein|nr:hypothetical protein [Polyangiaceae bacterium]
MLVVLAIAAMLVVVIGVAVVMALARKQVEADAAPPSMGADFVAPVSSGGYRFRAPDESPEDFKKRVDQENEDLASKK